MPDNRHIVVSLATDVHSPPHLWMADIDSDQLTPLTTGNAGERLPVVSPDGKSLIYSQSRANLDVVSVSLADGEAKTLISTGRQESMAAWAANQEKLVWVTDRNGPMAIWIRQPDGSERPLLTASDFPPGTHKWFMDPSLSPNAQQIVYVRVSYDGVTRLWISSLSGGVPVRLTNAEPSAEYGGAWSPDGKRLAYLQVQGGKNSLMVANISGRATPVTLVNDVLQYLPDWSPDGNWITYRDNQGWNLISPDGARRKPLGKIETAYLAFSRDSRQLYGIETWRKSSRSELRHSFFHRPCNPSAAKHQEPRKRSQPRIQPPARHPLQHLTRRQEPHLLHRQERRRPVDAPGLPPTRPLEPDRRRPSLRLVKVGGSAPRGLGISLVCLPRID